MRIKNIIEGIVLVIAIAVFGVAGYRLYVYMDEARKESEAVSMLSENAVRIYANTVADTVETKTQSVKNVISGTDSTPAITLDIDFDYLLSQNEDIKAWIYSPDTIINYPIVQSYDNDFYLRRLTDKTYNTAGTLFIDYRNSDDFSDYLTIIYGHHMKNGTMFGSISDYKEQDYYEQHPIIYIATPERTYSLVLVAGMVTDALSDTYVIPENIEERDEFLAQALKKTTFDSSIGVDDLGEDDRLVMLSTCSTEYEYARYVLIGVLK